MEIPRDRITPDNITELGPDDVFVFGSNTSGRHGKGAAKTAMKWGAVFGQGEGLRGRTYALPTVNASITRALDVQAIARHVEAFVTAAYVFSEKRFLVTEVGCGLAFRQGHRPLVSLRGRPSQRAPSPEILEGAATSQVE